MTKLRFAGLALLVVLSGWMIRPAIGQDLNTLLTYFITDLRAGTFSIGTAKDVTISSDGDGAVTFTGNGDGSDEALTINLDDTANEAVVSSSTGVIVLSLGSVNVAVGAVPATAGGLRLGNATSVTGRNSEDSANYTILNFDAAENVNIGDATVTSVTSLGTITYVNARLAMATRQAPTVDAATTFAITSSYVVLACTGAETINTITGGVTGAVVWLENTDTDCTIADDDDPTAANAIDLTGTATNDVGAVAKVIGLIYNGTSWLQIFESDN